MKICIDIQSTIGEITGVGRYTKMLVDAILKVNEKYEILLFYFDFMRRGSPFEEKGKYSEKAIRYVPGRFIQKLWKTIHFPPFNWFSGIADLYHFPNFIIPPLNCGKAIVTIHDTSFIRFPHFTEEKNLKYLTDNIKQTIERASAIITVSEFSANELKTLFPASAEKVYTVYPGVDHFRALPSEEKVNEVYKKYGITSPYLLNVGTLEPRKNHIFLVNIMEKLSNNLKLVIAGMKGWKYESILEAIYRSKKRANIIYLEYVSEEELSALYAGAALFVFPSLYEGFGFPPLEAMRHSLPVIATKAGSLPEVLGDAALLVDGAEDKDIDKWVSAIEELMQNSEKRNLLIKQGLEKAASFKWQNTAQETLKIYEKVVK